MIRSNLPIYYGDDCFKRVIALMTSRYAELTSSLWLSIASAGSPTPLLHVVHSPIARPVTVQDEDGHHLVFDQYLGQFFSRLTRMELCDAPPPIVDSYLFRLYGQRLLVAGSFRPAAAFALLSLSTPASDREAALREEPTDLAVRARMTHVQEAFAIAHELMHTVFKNEDVYGAHREVFDEVVEQAISRQRLWNSQRATDDSMAAFQHQYREDIRRLRARRGVDGAVQASPGEPVEDFADSTRFDLTEVMKRSDVRLEAMCDLFAAIAVAKTLKDVGLTTVDVLATTTLALQHLRLIQLLDGQVDVGASDSRLDDDSLQSIARVSLLRTGLAMMVPIIYPPSANSEAERIELNLHEAAVRLNRRHTSVVLDNLVLGLDLQHIRAGLLSDDSIADEISELATDVPKLRSLLGFQS